MICIPEGGGAAGQVGRHNGKASATREGERSGELVWITLTMDSLSHGSKDFDLLSSVRRGEVRRAVDTWDRACGAEGTVASASCFRATR
ncbi:hypothetical protein MPTK1_3g20040 [Marchantia polymorpha subsp. ruderalis]|nr:hypothetical protein MARPO_0049s0031 [Marchantia polymorpha]BBN06308.1 hypothetical protein Mp_3g20040 [Marchantia polymorpha subsp. ruderalis]|eukprot:PTQ38736.1 hypothetical protein MARPO_0049s0031 [Marchantia polymorpha]